MPLPILRRERTAQPKGPTPIDRDHPALSGVSSSLIAYGGIEGWLQNAGDLILPPTLGGVGAEGTTSLGSGFVFNGTSTYLDYGTNNIPTQEFTFLWGGVFTSVDNFRGLIDCISGANGWTIFQAGPDTLYFSINGYGGATSLSGWTAGQFWHGAVRWKTGGEHAWFRNGQKLSSSSVALTPGTSIASLRIGWQRGGGTVPLAGTMNYAYLLDKWLDDPLIVSLQDNPWQILRPKKRVVYVPPSTGSAGTASGVGAASGVGISDNAQVGSASGIGSAAGAGASINAQAGSSSGTSTVSGVGASDFSGVGSSSGTGAASGVGGEDIPSVGSSSGTSTADGVGTSSTGSFGTASGSATVNGIGSSTVDSMGSAAGIASASGVSASDASAIASASGLATVSGVGDSVVPGSTVGTASGSSSASGVGASIVSAVGSADGSAVAVGKGASTGGNVEHFAGGYVSREERAERVRKKRVELGIIEEEKPTTFKQFEISDLAEKKPVKATALKKSEKRIIALEQERIRRNEELKRLIQMEIEREEEQIIKLLMEM